MWKVNRYKHTDGIFTHVPCQSEYIKSITPEKYSESAEPPVKLGTTEPPSKQRTPNHSIQKKLTVGNAGNGGSSNEVVLTNIKMPFFSMVAFMIKWSIASIPAFIILFIIFFVVKVIFGAIVAGANGT